MRCSRVIVKLRAATNEVTLHLASRWAQRLYSPSDLKYLLKKKRDRKKRSYRAAAATTNWPDFSATRSPGERRANSRLAAGEGGKSKRDRKREKAKPPRRRSYLLLYSLPFLPFVSFHSYNLLSSCISRYNKSPGRSNLLLFYCALLFDYYLHAASLYFRIKKLTLQFKPLSLLVYNFFFFFFYKQALCNWKRWFHLRTARVLPRWQKR